MSFWLSCLGRDIFFNVFNLFSNIILNRFGSAMILFQRLEARRFPSPSSVDKIPENTHL